MSFRSTIAGWLAEETGLSRDQIETWLEIPPQQEMGDFAFPCFRLAKHLRRSPVQIAEDFVAKAGELDGIDDVRAVSGYLNFYVSRGSYVATTVARVLSVADNLGRQQIGTGQKVVVEYSSPNIAKPFHVGHAFTTILGHALYRLHDWLGYETVRVNHLGDYGTQFGKLIVAWRLWGDEAAVRDNPIGELLRIYVRFHEEAQTNPDLDDQAREAFRLLEAGSPEEQALWQKFRDLSLTSFEAVYKRLGVSFDSYRGESFYSSRIPDVIDLLKKKELLVESDGAQVVMLDEYKLPPCIILKSDGTTIYASRDIAAVLYRWEQYHFAKNIYVVGTPQALHFRQVFAVLDKAGIAAASQCVHVGFGLVKFADRKLSTRSGDVIFLSELLEESVEKTRAIIKENARLRQTDMCDQEIDEVAEKVGLGAVIYTFLKNGRERDIVFSWEEMLDFDGDSAPYVQYTYARARSILRKADPDDLPERMVTAKQLTCLATEDEFALAKLLDGFDKAIQKAAELYEPYLLVRQVTALARAFNKYYNHESILKTDDPALRRARLALLQAVCQAIRVGLDLVGISVVERM
ncbi:MAG: arginine--tRNA ligase [Ruminococcaceae bacterium]|nr:arginine--tRNA ligase [Oscillospiraceae bacterium]